MDNPECQGSGLNRRAFVARTLAAGAALSLPAACSVETRITPNATSGTEPPGPPIAAGVLPTDEHFELTISHALDRMKRGTLTSHALTQRYIRRIEAMDKRGPALNAVIELNPDALPIAQALDDERKNGKVRGPLHGVPVLIKDNIDSADKMRTSAGSLALAQSTPPKDAFIVERLRAAGAVLLGKTNLSEWANFRSTRSSSGWSGRGGQTRHPYVLDRNPCGSSSGTGAAIAADFATVGIGTETDGSIICPSSICGLVGVKPTVGLWSRSGIIPISASQDTAGPMARTVTDAAILLGALTGADPRDDATRASTGHALTDYTRFLEPGGLKAVRIGIARNLAGFHPDVDARFADAIAALKDAGATIVDPADIPGAGKFDNDELDVLLYEFKDGLNRYLLSLGDKAPVRSLTELIEWNVKERAREMPFFGQELFERAEKKGPLSDASYRDARAKCVRMARHEGIDATLAKYQLNAIVHPSNQPAWLTDHLNGDHFTGGNTTFAAVAGYPSVTVPMGNVQGLPVGLSFVGPAWSEGQLLRYAFAFEQHTRLRVAPKYVTTID
ncbi:MAG TPA: amidase [Gemmatimonadaceae bacterium]|nr:amidase [Gemmatimonadaceae bacterium]